MRSTIFNAIDTQIRPAAIYSVIESICAEGSINRSKLAEITGLSTSTVSKAVRVLLNTGAVTQKRTQRPEPNIKGAPESRVCLSSKICTAVLDLSSSIYSLNLICNGKLHLRYTHKYDPGLDFRDNVYEFISRAFLKIRLKEGVAMSVCVLYSDTASLDRNAQVYLPSEHDRELIDSTLYDVCRRVTSEYISKSQAIRDAVRFSVINSGGGLGGVSFLSIGSTLSAFYVSSDQTAITCKIQNLLIDNNVTAGEQIKRCVTNDQFRSLLVTAVNFIDAAFGASTLVLESDTFEIDAAAIKHISRSLAPARLSLPIVYPFYSGGNNAGICVQSAAKRTESNFVKSYIHCSGG